MTVIIDTNVLLVSISEKSKYHWLYETIIGQEIAVAISNEIITEYDEIISSQWHPDVAKNVVRSLLELPATIFSVPYFSLNLIAHDEDDNKFVDCAFASNADYIVTNDKHFDVLKL